MTLTRLAEATGLRFIDDLLGSRSWAESAVSFSFSGRAGDYAVSYGRDEASDGFRALDAGQKGAARAAMELWDELIAIDLVETAGEGDIRLAMSNMPNTAWAYGPGTSDEAGDVWFGREKNYYTAPEAGNYGFHTFIHEIGHALGLSHPHESRYLAAGGDVAEGGLCPCCAGILHGAEGAAGSGISAAGSSADDAASLSVSASFGGSVTASDADAMAFSIMSYASFAGDSGGYKNGRDSYATSPMLRDVAAVQHLYGADYSTRAGDTVYGWDERTGEKFVDGFGEGAGGRIFETLWDGGGRDTIDLSNYRAGVTVDLRPGAWSTFSDRQLADLGRGNEAPGNVALAYLVSGDARGFIENAVGGSGDDELAGNDAANVLVGGAGADVLSGGEGTDILAGDGLGDELDLVGLDLGDWISATIAADAEGGDDALSGGAGNDIFLTGAGDDRVEGGEGLDTLILAFGRADVTIEKDGGALVFTFKDGSVSAQEIEFVAFADGIFSVSGKGVLELAEDGIADEIGLIYAAGLGREIDDAGRVFWEESLAAGLELDGMAGALIDSPEFTTRFGAAETLDDAAFVDVLYRNVLSRDGDAGGAGYWVDAMADGLGRADLLVSFALSDENRMGGLAETVEGDPLDPIVADGGLDLVAVTAPQWAAIWG